MLPPNHPPFDSSQYPQDPVSNVGGVSSATAEATNQELGRLLALTDTALAHLALDDLLRELLARIVSVIGVDDVGILLLDADGKFLRLRAVQGLEEAVSVGVTIPMGQGLSGRVAATRAPLAANDLSTFPLFYSQARETEQSAAAVPLVVEERLLGVVYVGSASLRRFSEADIQLLQRAADRIALAIDRANAYEAVQAARAEAQLQAEQLDRIFEQMTDCLIVYDAAGRIVRENAAMRRLRSSLPTPPDALQRPLAERLALYGLRDADDLPLALEDMPVMRALRGETLTGPDAMDLRLRTLDGRELEPRYSAAPLRDRDGHIVGAICSAVDLTEQRRLVREREAALRESEAWFRTMADTAPVLLWVSDTEALVTFVNASWLQFTGRRLEQELGNGWADGVHPDDYAHCLQTYLAAFRARERFTVEYRLRRFDGEYRTFVDTGVPRFAPDGSFAGYIGSAIDITERERLKHEREEARASELAVREVNERLDTFVAMAAHDLRGPVAVSLLGIDGAQRQLEKLAERMQRSTPEQFREFAQTALALRAIEQSLDRLMRLVEQLLDVERVRSGMLVLNRAPTPLADLVRASVGEQRLLTPSREISLELPDPDDGPIMVDADADRLRQVLSNYLANAVRYSPEEQPIEVRLRLAAVGDVADESEEAISAAQAPQAADEGQMMGATSAQGAVSLAGATDSNSPQNGVQRDARMATHMARGKSRREVAWVEVRDHGRGISPGEQETIWSRFQRARTVREAKGLGLGLYIARMLVELHEGQVGLESDVGRGSTFWFTVPLVSGALAAESTPTPESVDSTE